MDEIMNDTDEGQKTLLEQVRGKPLGMYRYHHDPRKPDDYGMAKMLNPIGLHFNKSIEVIRNHKQEFPRKIKEAIEDDSFDENDSDQSPEDAFFVNIKIFDSKCLLFCWDKTAPGNPEDPSNKILEILDVGSASS